MWFASILVNRLLSGRRWILLRLPINSNTMSYLRDGRVVDFNLYDQPNPPDLTIQTFGRRLIIRTEIQCFIVDARTGSIL